MSRKAGGLSAWLLQRLSAVYMAVFIFGGLIPGLLLAPPLDYIAWRQQWTSPVLQISSGLFWMALLLHAWVGGRDIILDYVKSFAWRLGLLASFALSLMGLAFWVILCFSRLSS